MSTPPRQHKLNNVYGDHKPYRFLILCHNRRHNLGRCNTSGVQLTMSSLADAETLDEVVPDDDFGTYKINITLPIKTQISSTKTDLQSKFDLITTLCCPYTIYLDANKSLEPLQTSWENIVYMLKPSGIFIQTAGENIIKELATKNPAFKKQFSKKELSLITSDKFLEIVTRAIDRRSPVIATEDQSYVDMYVKGLNVYISLIQDVTHNKLQGTLVFKKENTELGKAILDRIIDFDSKYGNMGHGWYMDNKEEISEILHTTRCRYIKYHPIFVRVP